MMANFETSFIKGLILKSLVIGAVIAFVAQIWMGTWIAVSVAFGASVATLNLLTVSFVGKRILKAGEQGRTSGTVWALLLVLKMLVLFGAIFYLIVRLELDAIGFVAGFSVFLPAIAWQAAISYDDTSSSSLD